MSEAKPAGGDGADRPLLFDRLSVGDRFAPATGRTITDGIASVVVALAGYTHPLFNDEDYVKAGGHFAGRPLPGEVTLAFAGGLAEQAGVFDDSVVALAGFEDVRFPAPLLVGDTIRLEMEVVAKRKSSTPGRGVLRFRWCCKNQDDAVVLVAEGSMVVRIDATAG
jgi:acyl dehydratase